MGSEIEQSQPSQFFFSVVQWFRARWLIESYGRWMLRALWLVVAHDLLVHKRTVDVTGNLGVFFVLSNMARFWNCLRDYFVLSKWVRLKKRFSRSCLQVRKTDDLEMFSDFESALTCNSDFYLSAERLNARNSVSYKTLVMPTVRTFQVTSI